jgi:hypothetical protein
MAHLSKVQHPKQEHVVRAVRLRRGRPCKVTCGCGWRLAAPTPEAVAAGFAAHVRETGIPNRGARSRRVSRPALPDPGGTFHPSPVRNQGGVQP